jgi:hypothetical protein
VTPDIDWPSANLHTNVDALLGVGDGTTTTFQLRKEYTSGSTTAYVPITKPVSGTVKVSLDAVDQSSGWSVNLTTGVITFTVAPSAAVIVKAGCEFDIEARFGAEVDASLPISADQFSIGSVRSIPLIEVISGNTVNEERLALGGGRKAFTSSISIAQHEGITWELTPASSGLVVTVETAADLPSGGPHYMFYNAGADSLTLKGGAATIATLAAGADATLWIWKVAGVNTWKAVT